MVLFSANEGEKDSSTHYIIFAVCSVAIATVSATVAALICHVKQKRERDRCDGMYISFFTVPLFQYLNRE